ncbi:MAG: asparagine synthase (glutamine-hydrolyzing) [Verrucomicrobiota bacterium]
MCGIAGIFGLAREWSSGWTDILGQMAGGLAHRGPDAGGVWSDPGHGIGLAHRRLAIIDLSPHGTQPMPSASGRYVVSFNGEIYNYRSLRQEIEQLDPNHCWRSSSDTEVLLASIERWGLLPAVKRFVGMFALAIWDREEKSLSLVRDRLGEKPLYYARVRGALLFASEVRPFRAFPEFRRDVAKTPLRLFLKYGYIPGPWSIYRDVWKVMPGTVLRFVRGMSEPTVEYYWRAKEALGQKRPVGAAGETDLATELEALIAQAVDGQMLADVPVGAFLSGGIDSSTVVALMQARSSRPVKTFTVGFTDSSYNEAPHAREVARHLGTDHTELLLEPARALSVIPSLPEVYDEPFADSSQIPTLLVCRFARQQVKVALSGDGGDELLLGYGRYRQGQAMWRLLQFAPLGSRKILADWVGRVPVETWNYLSAPFSRRSAGSRKRRNVGDQLLKLAAIMAQPDGMSFYQSMVANWPNTDHLVSDQPDPGGQPSAWDLRTNGEGNLLARMNLFDLLAYLPDDILVKVDRAAMSIGLESRVPLLDHRIVEFCLGLQESVRARKGFTKQLLRDVLSRHVPARLFTRPKKGFSIPLAEWLRGPLKEWAEDLLSVSALQQAGLIDPHIVRQTWTEHLSGRRNWQYRLWTVLMLQAWLKKESQSPS